MKSLTRIARATGSFSRHGMALLLGALLVMGLLVNPAGGGRFQDEPTKDDDKPKVEPGAVEVRFADNSVLKLKLRDEKIEIVTPYGKLVVPVADIQHIDFASRLSEADEKRIPVLIGNLGSPEFDIRDTASAELLKLAGKAYPALVQAAKHKDPEVVRRATDLLEKIREAVPEENLVVRPHDVILTADSKITGRITTSSLKANTTQFGEVTVKLLDMRSLRSPGYVEPEKEIVKAVPAPQSLLGLQNQIGKVFYFTVTGANNGGIWGTDVYTLDSYLPTAAVHAGVLKVGQTGVVKVKIVMSPPAFTGSTRNGVMSSDYMMFQGAFQILKK
jgi:hypothetical protein